jgi:hypothetical protein
MSDARSDAEPGGVAAADAGAVGVSTSAVGGATAAVGVAAGGSVGPVVGADTEAPMVAAVVGPAVEAGPPPEQPMTIRELKTATMTGARFDRATGSSSELSPAGRQDAPAGARVPMLLSHYLADLSLHI